MSSYGMPNRKNAGKRAAAEIRQQPEIVYNTAAWTPEDDSKLRQLVAEAGSAEWHDKAEKLQNRNPNDVWTRWYRVLWPMTPFLPSSEELAKEAAQRAEKLAAEAAEKAAKEAAEKAAKDAADRAAAEAAAQAAKEAAERTATAAKAAAERAATEAAEEAARDAEDAKLREAAEREWKAAAEASEREYAEAVAARAAAAAASIAALAATAAELAAKIKKPEVPEKHCMPRWLCQFCEACHNSVIVRTAQRWCEVEGKCPKCKVKSEKEPFLPPWEASGQLRMLKEMEDPGQADSQMPEPKRRPPKPFRWKPPPRKKVKREQIKTEASACRPPENGIAAAAEEPVAEPQHGSTSSGGGGGASGGWHPDPNIADPAAEAKHWVEQVQAVFPPSSATYECFVKLMAAHHSKQFSIQVRYRTVHLRYRRVPHSNGSKQKIPIEDSQQKIPTEDSNADDTRAWCLQQTQAQVTTLFYGHPELLAATISAFRRFPDTQQDDGARHPDEPPPKRARGDGSGGGPKRFEKLKCALFVGFLGECFFFTAFRCVSTVQIACFLCLSLTNAVAIAGSGYQGFQRNPGAKTIEDELELALYKHHPQIRFSHLV